MTILQFLDNSPYVCFGIFLLLCAILNGIYRVCIAAATREMPDEDDDLI